MRTFSATIDDVRVSGRTQANIASHGMVPVAHLSTGGRVRGGLYSVVLLRFTLKRIAVQLRRMVLDLHESLRQR